MISTLLHLLRLCPFLRSGHRGGHCQLALENLALRQPLTVYQTAARVVSENSAPAQAARW
jgi:hypothetical protein